MAYRRYRNYRRARWSDASTVQPSGSALPPQVVAVITERFYGLSPAVLERVFRRWADEFGDGSAKYARQTYSGWKAGDKSPSAASLAHIEFAVGPELPLSVQRQIAPLLRARDVRILGTRVVRVTDLAGLDQAYRAVEAALTAAQPRWVGGQNWLDERVKEEILSAEASAVARERQDATTALEKLRPGLLADRPRPAQTVVLRAGGSEVRVIVDRKLSRAARAFHAVAVPAAWVAVIAAIGVWIYFANVGSGDGSVAKASSATPGHDTASVAYRTPTPLRPSSSSAPARSGSAAQAQTAAYTVVSGDSWSGIALKSGVSLTSLYAANGLSGPTRALNPGDIVLLPTGATAPPTPGLGPFIPYPGNGGGPTVCRDGMVSHSSGSGTCSHHGGIAR